VNVLENDLSPALVSLLFARLRRACTTRSKTHAPHVSFSHPLRCPKPAEIYLTSLFQRLGAVALHHDDGDNAHGQHRHEAHPVHQRVLHAIFRETSSLIEVPTTTKQYVSISTSTVSTIHSPRTQSPGRPRFRRRRTSHGAPGLTAHDRLPQGDSISSVNNISCLGHFRTQPSAPLEILTNSSFMASRVSVVCLSGWYLSDSLR
jgi:hypothetical protein